MQELRRPSARLLVLRRAGSARGVLFGATLAWSEPLNYAPSLRSVAGLLLALALESAYEDTPRLLVRVLRARARPATRARQRLFTDMPSCARRAPARVGEFALNLCGASRRCSSRSSGKEGVGVLVGDVQRATRRPATERSEGALLGARAPACGHMSERRRRRGYPRPTDRREIV